MVMIVDVFFLLQTIVIKWVHDKKKWDHNMVSKTIKTPTSRSQIHFRPRFKSPIGGELGPYRFKLQSSNLFMSLLFKKNLEIYLIV